MSDLPAFRALKLRRNPFGELTPDEWSAAAVVDMAPLVAWLDRPGRCLQLIGPCGRGKTTHLQALRTALPGAVFRRAGRDPIGPGSPLLLDEADAVGPFTRWRHHRHATTLAIATHRDLSRELGFFGWEVKTVEVRVTDPAVLAQIAARRIALVGDAPAPDLSHLPPTDDIRGLTDALYDAYQRPGTPHVTL